MNKALSILLLLAISISGCEYQKILKKGTPDEKLAAARKYYKKEDFNRALPLLEDLLGVFRRRAEAEEVYYLYAYTHYGMNDYVMASYHFKNFTETYRRSKHLEEASYMYARCEFHKTLPWQLDQTNTEKAIEKVQLFINKYPKSQYMEDCNELMDELRSKLHKKAYSTAMLYYNVGDFRSSIVSARNAVQDYPDIPQKDELEFLVVSSSLEYAEKSVQSAQVKRYNECLDYVKVYKSEYRPGEADYDKVLEIEKKATEAITKLEKLEAEASQNN